MSLLWQLAVFCLLASSLEGVQASPCDASCQTEQREALQLLFTSLSGSGWANNTGWDTAELSYPNQTWPAHCSWFGVACCLPKGYVVVPRRFTVPTLLPCSNPGAVGALHMTYNRLKGRLNSSAGDPWTTLAGIQHVSFLGAVTSFWPATFLDHACTDCCVSRCSSLQAHLGSPTPQRLGRALLNSVGASSLQVG